MEVIDPLPETSKKVDNQLLVITHLSQLLTFLTGFGGLVVPLILWLVKKDEVAGMDEHGKAIVNFQLSIILLALISIPCILLFGLGILMLIIIGITSLILPIVNAVRASNGESPNYFMTIPFIS
ncbi:MAG: DUF4870 domain-containing protein [Flavobacteriaceae bacterium]|nr:DUF4870 domain-containing protein [Flavobacteriaceae bacterium]